MTTGMTSPAWCCVRALNCLQNSMMLMPCCPSAGPTGGAGVALPALHWSLTTAWTGFAIRSSQSGAGLRAQLDRLHLQEVELDGGRAPEDAHHHFDLAPLGIDLVDDPVEGAERAVHDPHVIADAERHGRRRLAPGRLHLAEDPAHLVLLEGDRAAAGADETRHAGHVLHEVSRFVVEVHLDHDVRGERLALRGLPLAVLH